MEIPTIQVWRNGEQCIINESDFDASTDTLEPPIVEVTQSTTKK